MPDNLAQRIVLGIGGGISAYKAPDLVRKLRAGGAEIVPVLTRGAAHFVAEAALQAVSGHKPRTDMWDADAEAAMPHIALARWADAVLIAPATANLLARLAHGLADDLLTTLCLATEAPLFLAPAMNTRMWEHAATRRNLERLRRDGARILGPGDGEQACGEHGPGRMIEPADIAARVLAQPARALAPRAAPRRLDGLRVLVTAGPTREFLDPVRFISNRSSGRQGFAIAAAAREAGAAVALIAGPVQLPTPAGVERIDVVSAAEMHAAACRHAAGADIFVGVAAVADYRPRARHPRKLKKDALGAAPQLPLEANADIIGAIAALRPRPLIVGFAAETDDALARARDKRLRKNMDAIVVNDVSDARIGFDSAENAVTLIHAGGETPIARMPKHDVAQRLIGEIAALREARAADANAADTANTPNAHLPGETP